MQYYLVGCNRHDDRIHAVEDIDDTPVVHSTGKVKEHDVECVAVLDYLAHLAHGIVRSGHKQWVRRKFGVADCFGERFLERRAALHKIHVTLAHILDAELRIVAVNHKDFKPLHIVKVTRHENSQGGLARSTFLGGESDKFRVCHKI